MSFFLVSSFSFPLGDGHSSLWIDVFFVFFAVKTCRGILNPSNRPSTPSPEGYSRADIAEAPKNHTEAKQLVRD